MEIDAATLERLLAAADHIAIENVLGTYCRAIDRLDTGLLKSVYHPDGFDDHGALKMPAHEFAEHIVEQLRAACSYSMHTVTHAVIDIRGDHARSEAYYLGYHLVEGDPAAVEAFFGADYLAARRAAGQLGGRHEYLCGGRYLDELRKRDGHWRIQRRKMTNEFAICRPESPPTGGLPTAFRSPGSRDRADPVYHLALG